MRRMGRFLGMVALGVMVAAAPALTSTAAHAVRAKPLFSGGNSGSGAGTRYTAPGLGNIYGPDFPDTGLGEQAAQIRMRGGTLSLLRVSIVTSTATSGSVTVTVRINGVPTALTCSAGFAGGNCGTGGGTEVTVVNGDRLAIEVASTLDQGTWTYTYTLQAN